MINHSTLGRIYYRSNKARQIKNYYYMRKVVIFVLKTFAFLAALYGYSQQPSLSVQSFEYIWEKVGGSSLAQDKSRIIIASEDSARKAIGDYFAAALQKRWKIEMQDASLSVKPPAMFVMVPKFKTKLKEKQPGIWYLFLQIFDKKEITYVSAENNERRLSTLVLKCRLIDGGSDSMILDRVLTVELYEQPPPPGQVVLSRLPGYPSNFVQAFDSIAKWLFQPEDPGQKIIRIKPACVFTASASQAIPVAELVFNSTSKSIDHLTPPSFSFKTPGPGYKRLGVKRNWGGNTVGGVITLFTGISGNKVKIFEYSADFPFEENDSVYHCIVNYAERESAERTREKTRNSDGSKSYSLERGSYELVGRGTDSTFVNAITLADDTLATFWMSYISAAKERNNYKQYWDGSDSSTIAPLPREWNNIWGEDNVEIAGQMGANTFSMKTSAENNAKEFYLDDHLVMTVLGRVLPAKAFLFQSLSQHQIKMFTILASLPYPYFNYTAY